VASFRTRKETIKAQYSAAEAQTKINEAFAGVSDELSDVGLAVQRAEEKTANMQARAGAIDELISSGALEDFTGTSKDNLTRELEAMASQNDVESQLAAMRAEIGGGSPAPGAIGGGQAAGSPDAAPGQQQLGN
jgi:phage shock protein A